MNPSDAPPPQKPSGTVSLAHRPPGALEVRAALRSTGELQTHSVKLPFTIVGRGPQTGVRLDDPSVSQCHALLQLVDGVPYCIDLGSRTGVLWDDGCRGRGWVHPGQTLQIGMFDVQVSAAGVTHRPADEEPERDAPFAALDVFLPNGTSGRFTLDLPVTLIGRHPNCNLRFVDEAVAYFQCSLVRSHQGVWCVDLMSRRGTAVNGRFTRVALLRDGDLIELGKVSLVFHADPQPAHPPVAPGSAGVQAASGFELTFAPQKGAGAEAAVPAVREMMEQFQQCFMTMARMFTTMQQEHTAMMCEQMRQIQELLRETRAGQLTPPAAPSAAPPAAGSPPPASTPAPTPRPTPASKAPTPKPVTPEEAHLLADAHTWFLDRLNQKGNPSANTPK